VRPTLGWPAGGRSLTTIALLLAAGTGSRLGHESPKGFVPLGGRPLFLHSVDAIRASGVVDSITLIVPGSLLKHARQLVDDASSFVTNVVAGGALRADSVSLGLDAISPDTEVVVCHDAARPFAPPKLFKRAIAALEGADGVVPLVPSPDTVKRVKGRQILGTVPRGDVALAQTPQVFRANALRAAHQERRERPEPTDDATLLEEKGYRVVAVEGEVTNFKITTREDLHRAELVLSAGSGHITDAVPARRAGHRP
jgi:2-C-methyl-D-erythritol 4-phosphate cytidylyltransferase